MHFAHGLSGEVNLEPFCGMTKTAQFAISRGVAESVAETGATVNAIIPGPTRSEILSNWMQAQAESEGVTQAEAEQNFVRTMRPNLAPAAIQDHR